ncbi:MAG: hypothetical protein QOF62_856 [Pyrinomonadaceae bacterium]|jgi:hypothetical protein|nr:hypothetical protein [Pyrinomonadaceae bacterium]
MECRSLAINISLPWSEGRIPMLHLEVETTIYDSPFTIYHLLSRDC